MNESNRFDFRFPIYFLARRDTLLRDSRGNVGVNETTILLGGRLPDRTEYLSVFTDENRAKQFMAELGVDAKEVQAIPLHDRASFASLIQMKGFAPTAIGFDPPCPSAVSELPNFVVISKQDVLSALGS
jgi:hypothetical protein